MDHVAPLAAAQTVPVAGDVDANVRQHIGLIESAADEQVSLLVFPELSLTGYELAAGLELALSVDDARLRPLTAAAHACGITLVVGAPLRTSSGLHIGAFIIEPSGEVNAYTKRHLGAFRPEDAVQGVIPPPESALYVPGDLNPIICWQGRKLAVSICADSAHPSHPKAAAERGATVYASCQFAIAAHMPFKMARLKEAAKSHGLTVVFANYGGPTGGLPAAGGSSIRTPCGDVVARLPASGLGLAVARHDETGWTGKVRLLGQPR